MSSMTVNTSSINRAHPSSTQPSLNGSIISGNFSRHSVDSKEDPETVNFNSIIEQINEAPLPTYERETLKQIILQIQHNSLEKKNNCSDIVKEPFVAQLIQLAIPGLTNQDCKVFINKLFDLAKRPISFSDNFGSPKNSDAINQTLRNLHFYNYSEKEKAKLFDTMNIDIYGNKKDNKADVKNAPEIMEQHIKNFIAKVDNCVDMNKGNVGALTVRWLVEKGHLETAEKLLEHLTEEAFGANTYDRYNISFIWQGLLKYAVESQQLSLIKALLPRMSLYDINKQSYDYSKKTALLLSMEDNKDLQIFFALLPYCVENGMLINTDRGISGYVYESLVFNAAFKNEERSKIFIPALIPYIPASYIYLPRRFSTNNEIQKVDELVRHAKKTIQEFQEKYKFRGYEYTLKQVNALLLEKESSTKQVTKNSSN